MPPKGRPRPPTCEVCGKPHWRGATMDSLAHYNMPEQEKHPKDLLEILETKEI